MIKVLGVWATTEAFIWSTPGRVNQDWGRVGTYWWYSTTWEANQFGRVSLQHYWYRILNDKMLSVVLLVLLAVCAKAFRELKSTCTIRRCSLSLFLANSTLLVKKLMSRAYLKKFHSSPLVLWINCLQCICWPVVVICTHQTSSSMPLHNEKTRYDSHLNDWQFNFVPLIHIFDVQLFSQPIKELEVIVSIGP